MEIQENTESSVRLESSLTESRADSESKQLTESCVCAKRKGVYPLPAPKALKKNKAPLFLLRFACNPLGLFGSHKVYLLAGVPRFSASSAIVAEGTPASLPQRLHTTKRARDGMR